MNRAVSALIAATALSASLLVTSCSAGDDTSAQPPAADPTSASQPATSAPASPTTETTTEASSPAEKTDEGDKPSKSDVVAGLTKFYENDQKLPADKAKKFAVCMVDEMYDKAKTKTMIAMMNGTPTEMDPSDANLLAQSGVKCAKTLS